MTRFTASATLTLMSLVALAGSIGVVLYVVGLIGTNHAYPVATHKR